VCVVARPVFAGGDRNLIAAWDELDRTARSHAVLPAPGRVGAPLGYGGATLHVRRISLEHIGGWDAFNAAPEVDLALRMGRAGFKLATLRSVTIEEANSDAVNFVRQRARRMVGDLQSWLVHRRFRSAALSRRIAISLLVGASLPVALLRPIVVVSSVFVLGNQHDQTGLVASFPGWLDRLALAALVSAFIGYAAVVASGARRSRRHLQAALLAPVWSVVLAYASLKALLTFAARPGQWERTRHGLVTELPHPAAGRA
jgi:cellulose synthase/poly-beta-1,6-N-acetylglucosamine synthase-like glycosyltransferase